jgi:hypothetical protein
MKHTQDVTHLGCTNLPHFTNSTLWLRGAELDGDHETLQSRMGRSFRRSVQHVYHYFMRCLSLIATVQAVLVQT